MSVEKNLVAYLKPKPINSAQSEMSKDCSRNIGILFKLKTECSTEWFSEQRI
jgi:hypothetical protein